MARNEIWVHAEAPKERTWTPGNHSNAGKLVSSVFLYQHQTNIDLSRSHLKWFYTVAVYNCSTSDLIFYLWSLNYIIKDYG